MEYLKKIIKLKISYNTWSDYQFGVKVIVTIFGLELWCVYIKSNAMFKIITDIGTFK